MIAKEKWGFPQAQDPVVRLKIVILIAQNPSNRNFVGHADRWCGRGWQEYVPSVQSPFASSDDIHDIHGPNSLYLVTKSSLKALQN